MGGKVDVVFSNLVEAAVADVECQLVKTKRALESCRPGNTGSNTDLERALQQHS